MSLTPTNQNEATRLFSEGRGVEPRARRPYAKPELVELGSVRELTQNAAGSKGDGGFGRQVG